jgi:hypothetical protein
MKKRIISLMIVNLLLFCGIIGVIDLTTEPAEALNTISVPFTLTIDRIFEQDQTIDSGNPPDFYFGMRVYGYDAFSNLYQDLKVSKSSKVPVKWNDGDLNQTEIGSDKKISQNIACKPNKNKEYKFGVRIAVWEKDNASGDDLCDVSPYMGAGQPNVGKVWRKETNLEIRYDIFSGVVDYLTNMGWRVASKSSGGYYKLSGRMDGSKGNTSQDVGVQFFISDSYKDDTAPTTTCSLSGTKGNSNWYISDVKATLSATDNSGGTGVRYTQYKLNSGSWKTYSSKVTISTEGSNTFYYRSKDYKNLETQKSVFVKIDKKDPGTPNPDDTIDGWSTNNTRFFSFSSVDTGSGVAKYFWRIDSGPYNETNQTRVELPTMPDGAYQFHVFAQDRVGRNSTIAIHPFKIDTTKPEPFTPTSDIENWTNSNPTIYFDTTDSLSGIDHYEVDSGLGFKTRTSPYTITGLFDGIYNFKVRAFDKAGNYEDGSVEVKIDKSTPKYFEALADPSNWTNTDPTIYFETTDEPSGIDHYKVNTGSGFYEQTSPYVLNGLNDGIHTIYVKAFDKAGNYLEAPVEIKIDKTPPSSFKVISDPDTWTNMDPTITFSTTDFTSGVDRYEVDAGTGFSEQMSPYTALGLSDGVHTITVRAIDYAGNYQEETVVVKIDKTEPKPFIVLADTDTWTNTEPTITFFTIDTTSEIIYYNVDLGTGFENQSSPYTISGLADGVHTIKVRAYDTARNYREEIVEVFIDKTKPKSFEVIPTTNTWTSQNPTIYFETTDDTSGVDQYKVNSGDGYQEQNSPLTLNELDDGIHEVKVRAYDMAGNYIESSCKLFIDKTPPELIEFSPNDSDIPITTRIKITFNEQMNRSTVEDAFHISPVIDGEFKWKGRNLTFKPASMLEYNTTYTITLDNKASDMARNAIIAPFEWNFTTKRIIIKDTDLDNDDIPDLVDAFPNDPSQWLDSDGDNYGNNPSGKNPDAFPKDSTKWKIEEEEKGGARGDTDDSGWWLAIVIIIIIVVIIVIISVFFFISKNKSKHTSQEHQLPPQDQNQKPPYPGKLQAPPPQITPQQPRQPFPLQQQPRKPPMTHKRLMIQPPRPNYPPQRYSPIPIPPQSRYSIPEPRPNFPPQQYQPIPPQPQSRFNIPGPTQSIHPRPVYRPYSYANRLQDNIPRPKMDKIPEKTNDISDQIDWDEEDAENVSEDVDWE